MIFHRRIIFKDGNRAYGKTSGLFNPYKPFIFIFYQNSSGFISLLISILKLAQIQHLQINHLTILFNSLKNIALYMLIQVYNQFIIAMKEEEFDEFEEATYSKPPTTVDAPSPPSPLSTHAAMALHLPPDHDSNHPILPPSSLPAAQLNTEPLENGSSLGEESIWPQLGKSSSAHVVPIEPFMIDFSKSYSLSEQMSIPITDDFFGAAGKEQPELAALHLPPPNIDIISPLPPTTAVLGRNNNLLFEFSAPQDGLDLFGFNSVSATTPSMEAKEAKILPKVEESVVSTYAYAPGGVNVGNEFDIFTPVTQNTARTGYQQQVKIDNKEEAGLLGDIGDFQYVAQPILQFKDPYIEVSPTLITNIPEAGPVVQVPQVKTQPQDLNWMQAYPATTITTTNNQPNFDQNQPTITEEAADRDHKESEEFQFHEAKPANFEPEPEDIRKESEQFVFETTIQPLTTTQDMLQTQIQDFGHEWSSQPNHQILPQKQPPLYIQPPEVEVFQQPKEEEAAQQPLPPEEEEDQFGDFEESTQAQDHQAQPEVIANGVIEQDNKVEIKEQYVNSSQDDFYGGRQKQLQEFVNSLPDYSFLFAQGFL